MVYYEVTWRENQRKGKETKGERCWGKGSEERKRPGTERGDRNQLRENRWNEGEEEESKRTEDQENQRGQVGEERE